MTVLNGVLGLLQSLVVTSPFGSPSAYGLTPATDPADTLTGTYPRHYSAALVAPWLRNAQKTAFLSTEDDRSIGAKADHVVRRAHASGESPGIPNGRINPGWRYEHWPRLAYHHVEFADFAIEVCDHAGYIDELGYEEFVSQHGQSFCPWNAELVGFSGPS